MECVWRLMQVAFQVETSDRNILPDDRPERLGRQRIVVARPNSEDHPSPERT
jgi:hypothetical protein